ncbi:MAG: DUF2752 domain-containing protein [Clostridiales bacterium]|nr:DUF2752 domain-containing protein [Clostridiales bacterium]
MLEYKQKQDKKLKSSKQSVDPQSKEGHNKRHCFGLKLLTVIIPIAILLIVAQRDWLIHLAFQLPACPFFTLYDIYCPACGNTRSISALLHGKLLTSLRFNIVPILLLLFCLGAYIELVAYSFGKRIYLLPRKSSFYQILGILLAVYLIVRNFIPYLTP